MFFPVLFTIPFNLLPPRKRNETPNPSENLLTYQARIVYLCTPRGSLSLSSYPENHRPLLLGTHEPNSFFTSIFVEARLFKSEPCREDASALCPRARHSESSLSARKGHSFVSLTKKEELEGHARARASADFAGPRFGKCGNSGGMRGWIMGGRRYEAR